MTSKEILSGVYSLLYDAYRNGEVAYAAYDRIYDALRIFEQKLSDEQGIVLDAYKGVE